jgi:hypothetical protein
VLVAFEAEVREIRDLIRQMSLANPVPSLLGPVGVKRFQVFPSVWC